MKVVTKEVDFRQGMRMKDALAYVRRTLGHASEIKMSIKWGFDEQQADGFHKSWTADKFILAVARIVSKDICWKADDEVSEDIPLSSLL